MDWIKVTPETMPPDMDPVIVTAVHQGFVEEMPEIEKSVFTDVRWNNDIQAWEIKEWNICQFEWTTWHDLKVTHWTPMPKPAEDCKTEEDCIPTPHLIDATTSQDIISGRYPVYTLGFGVSEDDLTEDEWSLLEQSKRWRKDWV